MSPRDRARAEAVERLFVCAFIVIILALSAGAFGN